VLRLGFWFLITLGWHSLLRYFPVVLDGKFATTTTASIDSTTTTTTTVTTTTTNNNNNNNNNKILYF
jgi:hypothetical protein